ncbi:MAG: glycosyltransferase family 9 protein [Melioribacteraceae bacterium]|nr:glycosyltransferase family 9 protein [Melioribacteraceae bacterium]
MAALCGKVDFLIANDSGPMHIATALETPVLSIHGPTDPKLQGPYQSKHEWINKSDLHCIICNLTECPYNQECFRELPVEDVIQKIDTLLQKNDLLRKV